MTGRMLVLGLVVLGAAAAAADADTITVNCDRRQSLTAALSRLDRHGPHTLVIRGTCNEAVTIRGFDFLTLRGEAGAVITRPPGDSYSRTLEIADSRDVTLRDLAVWASCSGSGPCFSLWVGNCQSCRFERTTLEGTTLAYGANYAVFVKSTFRSNGGYAAFAAYDNSFSLLVNCLVEPGSASGWWGIQASGGPIVSLGGTTIRGHGNGIGLQNGARLVITDFGGLPGAEPDQTVVIEDNWFRGVDLEAGSAADIGGEARIEHNGDGLGGRRVGLMVKDGSVARIFEGARIVGTQGNGLAVVTNSTVSILPTGLSAGVEISGSLARDVYCDASSIITGDSAVTGATKVTCPNLKPNSEGDPLPSQ